MARDERSFDEFTRARLPHLLMLARTLTCDERDAEALVEESLAPVLDRWDESSPFTAEEEVRRAMVRSALRRTPSHAVEDPVWEALADLSPRERAAVALRLHEDLTDEQAAEVLDCSPAAARDAAERALARVDAAATRDAVHEPVPMDDSVMTEIRSLAAKRRRRRLRLTAAVAVVAALVLGGVLVTSGGSGAAGLDYPVLVMDAVSEDTVWAMTRDRECPQCTVLWRGDGSPDGWEEVYTFRVAVIRAQLLMAPDGRNGYAWFASGNLQVTHDGGTTWAVPELDTRDAQVEVAIAGERAYAFVTGRRGNQLFSSELDGDQWEPVAEAVDTPKTLVPIGDDLLWLDHSDPIASLLAPVDDPTDVRLLPCSERDVSASAKTLWTTCSIEGGQQVLQSTDLATWTEFASVSRARPDVYPASDDTVLLITFDGAVLVTADDQTEVALGLDAGDSVSEVRFPTDRTGYLRTYAGEVLHSDDGGLTWQSIS